jgi:cellulose synthase/poly-beta-1,6-N-acetylglucosamine synthase-like glycosyltransferase
MSSWSSVITFVSGVRPRHITRERARPRAASVCAEDTASARAPVPSLPSHGATGPAVSVVVPAMNAEATIGPCLAALTHQTMPKTRYEVIVVDDASTDRTASIAEGAGARVVRLERRMGPGGARNAGIEAARGDLIVFTDADCEPCHTFLEALVTPLLTDSSLGATKGSYLTRQSSHVAQFVQLEYEERYRRMRRHGWIDFVDTYAACFRRADLVQAGGFDTRLRQCQDQELSFRLAAGGIRIRFVEEARTFHLHADRLSGYVRKKFRIAWWKVAVLRQHPDKVITDSHTPQGLKLEIAAAYMAVSATAGAVLLLAAGGLSGSGAVSAMFNTAVTTAGVAAVLFMCLVAPLTGRALRRSVAVGLKTPPMLFMRALALGAGLIAGLLRPPAMDVQTLAGGVPGASLPRPAVTGRVTEAQR